MEVYKLRHKPTGLYYQPVKGPYSSGKTNLAKKGKLYETKQYPKLDTLTGSLNISQSLIKNYKIPVESLRTATWANETFLKTEPEDWEVVVFNLTEITTIEFK